MTNVITRHGREFEFDDDVPEETQNKRIENWMRKNAPDELEPPKKKAEEPAPERAPEQQTTESSAPKKNFNPALAEIATALLAPMPIVGQAARALPGMYEMLGDVNLYRTMGQGALPFADEATAGVRSMLPGGPDYDTALNEERQGVKDFGTSYGEDAKVAAQLLGSAATIPLGAGAASMAGRAVPWLGRAGAWMLQNPWKASVLSGAATGAVGGFGAGEGLEDRLTGARDQALLGAALGPTAYAGVRSVDKLLGELNIKNRVASLLRKNLASEREVTRNIDPETSRFTDAVMPDLRRDIRARGALGTEPMLADVLPHLTETTTQRPGVQTEGLVRSMLRRQYNETLPQDLARFAGQRGRVERSFDTAFGPDKFRKTDEELVDEMRNNAKRAFRPAYQQNIRTQEIDDALDKIYSLGEGRSIWQKAVERANADQRPIGSFFGGELKRYNTEFLHDIKWSIDQAVGAGKTANIKFDDRVLNNAKKQLNEAMKNVNPAYKRAMEQYGEDAGMVSALKKGREEAFPKGSVDTGGGMEAKDITAYLADPNKTQAEKDLFRLGAARALREDVLGRKGAKWSHNWADFVNNPGMEERMDALLSDRLGSWNILRNKLKAETNNYKTFQKAVGNSATAKRLISQNELEGGPDIGRAMASATNPTAYGSLLSLGHAIWDKARRANTVAGEAATILGRQTQRGTRQSLNEIEALLRQQDARRQLYGRLGAVLPGGAAYSYPFREGRF